MYHFVASTDTGAIRRGTSDLASRDAVIQDLEARGLLVVSVEEQRRPKSADRVTAWLIGTVGHVEKVLFTKHLSVMLRSGLTLLESLGILVEQAATWRFRTMLASVYRRVERGERFSDGLESYPQVFSPFYINIIRSGEASGTLEENLDHLAEQFTKEHELRQKVRTALLYPTIVLCAALLIGFFFATYVLPQVAGLFTGLKGAELPLVTRIMLKGSDIARRHTFLSFVGIFGSVYFLWWLVRRRMFAPITHAAVLRVPGIGSIVRDVNLARFALVMGTMLRSGIEITKALEVTGRVLGNVHYKKVLDRVLAGVQRGQPMSDVLVQHPTLFPKVSSRMIGVGERAGRLEDVLGYLSDFYELEVENAVKNLQTILEPVLLLFIGGVALAMAFAILIPIYNFVAAIRTI